MCSALDKTPRPLRAGGGASRPCCRKKNVSEQACIQRGMYPNKRAFFRRPKFFWGHRWSMYVLTSGGNRIFWKFIYTTQTCRYHLLVLGQKPVRIYFTDAPLWTYVHASIFGGVNLFFRKTLNGRLSPPRIAPIFMKKQAFRSH